MLAACSDSDKNNDDNGKTPAVNTDADVVILSYVIGGGDLDYDSEIDMIRAAINLPYSNVRYFAQYKYSSQEGYAKKFAKSKKEDPAYNYQMSGDYGKVYRFELSPGMLNPPT